MQAGLSKKARVSRDGGMLVIRLHHQRCKKVKFMMELHHRSPKEREVSIGASP